MTDIFASWLPLYYEVKILFVLYLMLPQTKGSDTVFTHYLYVHCIVALDLQNVRTFAILGLRGPGP